MTIRRGRNDWPETDKFATLDLAHLSESLTIGPGESMLDVFGRLDPERISAIIGVTKEGGFHTPSVAAFGEKLLSNFKIAVDLVVVPPGAGFPVHAHPGDHLLYCIAGLGTFSLAGEVYEVKPGALSMVEGSVPHAVGNPYDQPHVLLAIGSPPRELDAPDRMKVMHWNGEPVHVDESTGCTCDSETPMLLGYNHADDCPMVVRRRVPIDG